jgi:import inner membrane translocase subunit TIM13
MQGAPVYSGKSCDDANLPRLQKINENCFEKCVPKPGSSVSSSERTCVTQCMEKYMAAWNQVNSTYLRRIQQEVGNNSALST